MSEQDIYADVLKRAVQFIGSAQALATELHVPETTLQYWMSGRAPMPERAFLLLIEIIGRYSK